MPKHIDYDRGVLIRTNPTLGMDVFMYADDPGVYLNAAGKQVPPATAKAAGYDIDRWAKLRKKKLAMQSFAKQLDATDLQDKEGTSRTVIADRDGFQLVEMTLGRAQIMSPDGDAITQPVAIELARKAFDDMFPPEDVSGSEYEREIEARHPVVTADKIAKRKA